MRNPLLSWRNRQAAARTTPQVGLGWLDIVRLGLVQTALGAIVVLTTSTLNRVMVVELALPAMLPGALVALHYAVQMARPRWGHGSDVSGRRTPWILFGMVMLAAGAVLAAVGTAWMADNATWGTCVATLAFVMIGIGVGAAGTNLLTLLATKVAPARRPAAASIVWMMMIVGFVVTAATAGAWLDPFSFSRLIAITAIVGVIATTVATVAVWGIEARAPDISVSDVTEAHVATSSSAEATAQTAQMAPSASAKPSFREAIGEVWSEPQARNFTIFVFTSMFAYSAQDLILEPFAGLVFAMTPGESTSLAGVQHGGVLLGMIMVAVLGTAVGGPRLGSLRLWTVGGCLASSVALLGLAAGAAVGPTWPLTANVFALGLANGAFAVAAIASMMGLAGAGTKGREGVRMGLWGASQAIAFGIGGFLGAAAVDGMNLFVDAPAAAYGVVFAAEGLLFVVAARQALGVGPTREDARRMSPLAAGEGYLAEAR